MKQINHESAAKNGIFEKLKKVSWGEAAVNLDKIIFIVLAVLLVFAYIPFLPKTGIPDILFVVSIIATIPVVWSATKSIMNKEISVDLLASVALVASFLAQQWNSVAFINLMLTSARIFGSYTESKAHAAIESLFKLRPEKIKIRRGKEVVEIHIDDVKIGDLVVVETGERVPIDGEIIQGDASIDQSSLTGESVPVNKTVGDKVLSSTLNVSGSLLVKTEKVGKDTTLEKIIALVDESQKQKSDIRTTADKFADWYVAIAFVGAATIYFFSRDIDLVLSVLLVVCADDIAIAVPLAFYSAIGYAARRGVIVKGGKFLEGLTKIKTVVMDKTGTLTLGKLKVEEIYPLNGEKTEDVTKMAALSDFFSGHPSAKAVMRYAKDKGVSFRKPDTFEERPGYGTLATFGSDKYISGNVKFFKKLDIKISDEDDKKIKEYQDKGYSTTLIGHNGKLAGLVILADEIRPGAKEALASMRNLGVEHYIMLTGDNERVAARVASELNISEFHANLLPEDKVAFVRENIKKLHSTAMIGDGVNDAASLALADVGIAMGAIGSDAAIESADVALMRDDIKELPQVMRLGRYTMRIARQDFLIWAITNAAGLFLVFTRVIGPDGAAAFNFVTDFFPLLNSIRLFNLHRKLKT
ncbi:MAG TPA: cation-translocating P-type ATPase [Candidatus Paceibacterota bacterium]|nr:cation-translocating P-type ATPase [Candidatus Paceibacterota bacterium]